ncbi:hypothetical protein FQA39_LY02264 [Lamprigera yunnana]|nr:hypothetical protein FQA39_LY02264 [Lamprigera yunnana]
MKICFIILICSLMEASADQYYSAKFRNSMLMCSRKTQLRIYRYSDLVAELYKGGKQIQLFSKCLLEQLSYLSSNGTILYEDIKKISPYNVADTVDQCKKVVGNDVTEMHYKFLKCVVSNIVSTKEYQTYYMQKHQQALKTCSQRTNPAFQRHDVYIKALATGGLQIEQFSECMLRELYYLDKNGTILYEEVKKMPTRGISSEIYGSIVDQCKTLKGNNTGETSYKFSKCVVTNVLKIQEQQIPIYIRYQRAARFCSEKFDRNFRLYHIQLRALNGGGKQIELYSECLYKELGYLDSNGTILYDEVKKANIHFVKSSDSVDKCKNERGNSTAETCYKFRKCLINNMLKTREQQKNLLDRCQQAIRMCSQKTNSRFRNYDEYIKALAVDGEQIQVFSECVLQELGYLDSNRTILYDELKNATVYGITRERCHQIIDQCKTEKGNTTSNTTYKFSKCFFTNMSRAYDQQKPLYQRLHRATIFCSEKINRTFQRHHVQMAALDAGGNQIQLYSECLLRELDYLDSNGIILLVDKCKIEKGNSTAETCYKFRKCVNSNILKTQEQQKPLDNRLQLAIYTCSKNTNTTLRNYDEYFKALAVGGPQAEIISECVLRQLGYLDSNGTIQYEELKTAYIYSITREKFQSAIDECKIVKGNNTTETAYRFSKCFFGKLRKARDHQKPFYLRNHQALKFCSEKTNRTFQRPEIYYTALIEGGKQIKSFCECMLQELDYIDNNGSILYEQVKKNPPQGISYATYSTFVDKCKNKVGNDTAETYYKFSKCMGYQQQYKLVNERHERARRICSLKTKREFLKDDVYISALSTGGESIQLYCECMLKELGYLSRYGTILYEEIKRDPIEGVSLEQQASIVDKCRNEVGNNSRETSYKFTKCFVTNIMKTQQ